MKFEIAHMVKTINTCMNTYKVYYVIAIKFRIVGILIGNFSIKKFHCQLHVPANHVGESDCLPKVLITAL